MNHELEALEAMKNSRYDIANFHATMFAAQTQRTTALIAAVNKWGTDIPTWPLAVREGLSL